MRLALMEVENLPSASCFSRSPYLFVVGLFVVPVLVVPVKVNLAF